MKNNLFRRAFAPLAMLALSSTFCSARAVPSPYRWRDGVASYHAYSNRGFVCAARGVPRGSIVRVRANGRVVDCLVIDACGKPMAKMGRHLDLNPRAFKALFGSLRRGVGPVRFKLIKRGHGAMTGKAW